MITISFYSFTEEEREGEKERKRGREREREREIILIPPFTCLTVFEGMNVN